MKKKKYFYQDFLFENIPVDEQDNPIVTMLEISSDIDVEDCEIISLDTMLRMNKIQEWDNLFIRIKNGNVCIKDDTFVKNPEMDIYKTFYLKVYYHNLSKHCNKVYVQSKNDL